ncbi:hypothetical protein BpHYR1_052884 [Brachionus plicatilis]|uniref:Uncharacterized protein n=1 Tax=Brachionus plicatilis TaxID=10195 RepID=A0A3M7QBC4_BRAPC|nr:hypothetical protein BpHYR1_052884 [Brachionus plicatilis]
MDAFGYEKHEDFKRVMCWAHSGLIQQIQDDMKSIHTLRERLAVNSYLRNAYDMFRNWSKDSLTEREFSKSYNVSAKTWGMAYDFLHSTDSIIKRFVKGLNFDLLMEYNDKIKIIDFNTDNWATTGNQNLLTIPKRYIKTAIEPKKKAGRIDKAKQAKKVVNIKVILSQLKSLNLSLRFLMSNYLT